MSGLVSCRDCGTPLMTGGGLEGRCARCLLELAIEESQAGRAGAIRSDHGGRAV